MNFNIEDHPYKKHKPLTVIYDMFESFFYYSVGLHQIIPLPGINAERAAKQLYEFPKTHL